MAEPARAADGRDGPAAAPTSGPGTALGRWALHPVLLVAYPTLALWGANVHEVDPAEGLAVLWPTIAVAVAAWLLMTGILAVTGRGRPVARAGIVVSVAGVVVLTAGRILPSASPWSGLVLVVGAVLVAVAVAWWVSPAALARVTVVGNVFAVVATVLAMTSLQPVLSSARAAPVLVDFDGADAPARDIWYIIPDRYPRADTLATEYDFDNSAFLAHLEERGFSIQDRARANYPKTAHSLAATWNLDVVQELVPEPPADESDWAPLYDLLDDHRLGRFLTDAGFDYVHLGSWWGPTADARAATSSPALSDDTEFETVWRTTTALRWLGEPDDEGLDNRRRIRAVTDFQLDELDRLVTEPNDRPRFVLAHLTVPHEPYVYDADGSYVSAELEASRSRQENTVNQLVHLNSRLEALVDRLLTGDPATDPIIVIQSDEGPHPDEQYDAGQAMNWLEATTEVRAEKLRTFSAWYLPQVDHEVPDDLTGVNTWRFILDRYFGTDLGLLPDRVWIFTDEQHAYTFTEVTDDFE